MLGDGAPLCGARSSSANSGAWVWEWGGRVHGGLAGAEEAQEKEKVRNRRLREDAANAKLAMEASAKVAIDASAQARQAAKAREDAEARAAVAEAERRRAERERGLAEEEARRRLVSAQNTRRAIAGRLSGDEADWTKIAYDARRLTSALIIASLLLLGAILAYFGWLIKTATGVAVVSGVIFATSIFTVLNDTVKAKAKDWVSTYAEKWTEKQLSRLTRKLEKRLGIPQGLVRTKQADGRVFIVNRDEIIEAIENASDGSAA